jgi:hypothetical protein
MQEHSYSDAWHDLEQREAILKVVSWVAIPLTFIPELAFVPLMLVAFLVFDFFSIQSLPWQISLFVLVVSLGLIGLWCIMLSFRCPRCHKLFFFKKIYFAHNPHDRSRCVHCGLPKGATPEVQSGQTITAP